MLMNPLITFVCAFVVTGFCDFAKQVVETLGEQHIGEIVVLHSLRRELFGETVGKDCTADSGANWCAGNGKMSGRWQHHEEWCRSETCLKETKTRLDVRRASHNLCWPVRWST